MEKKTSILIVDDDGALCKNMSFILGRNGYAVTTAKDGSEAIERVRERPFDMIFMDIKIPLMNGIETYRRIKEIRPEAEVVVMTGYSVEDLIQEALQEGAWGILQKPLDMEKVFTLIENARELKKAAVILTADNKQRHVSALKI